MPWRRVGGQCLAGGPGRWQGLGVRGKGEPPVPGAAPSGSAQPAQDGAAGGSPAWPETPRDQAQTQQTASLFSP